MVKRKYSKVCLFVRSDMRVEKEKKKTASCNKKIQRYKMMKRGNEQRNQLQNGCDRWI